SSASRPDRDRDERGFDRRRACHSHLPTSGLDRGAGVAARGAPAAGGLYAQSVWPNRPAAGGVPRAAGRSRGRLGPARAGTEPANENPGRARRTVTAAREGLGPERSGVDLAKRGTGQRRDPTDATAANPCQVANRGAAAALPTGAGALPRGPDG